MSPIEQYVNKIKFLLKINAVRNAYDFANELVKVFPNDKAVVESYVEAALLSNNVNSAYHYLILIMNLHSDNYHDSHKWNDMFLKYKSKFTLKDPIVLHTPVKLLAVNVIDVVVYIEHSLNREHILKVLDNINNYVLDVQLVNKWTLLIAPNLAKGVNDIDLQEIKISAPYANVTISINNHCNCELVGDSASLYTLYCFDKWHFNVPLDYIKLAIDIIMNDDVYILYLHNISHENNNNQWAQIGKTDYYYMKVTNRKEHVPYVLNRQTRKESYLYEYGALQGINGNTIKSLKINS